MGDGGPPKRLAPVADVLAVAVADDGLRRRADLHLGAAGYRSAVFGRWVIADRPLPGSRPDDGAGARAGFAFAEGGERVSRSPWGVEGLAGQLREGRVGVGVGRVTGDVGFVWVDPVPGSSARVAVAVRSAAGRVPLWWWVGAGAACVGSRLADVLAVRSVVGEGAASTGTGGTSGAGVLAGMAAAAMVSGQAAYPGGQTATDGVRLLPPGSVLDLPASTAEAARVGAADGGRGPEPTRWYDPWPEVRDLPRAKRGSAFAEVAERFDAAVRSVLVDELDPDGGNLLSLSGGVDSASLAHLARAVDRPIGALSLVPDGDDPLHEREMGFLQPLVADTGIDPWRHEPLTMEHRLEWLAAAPAAPLPVVHPVLCLLPSARVDGALGAAGADGAHVLVGGEFCDELSGGTFMLVDWARTASPAEAALAVRHGIVRRTWGKRWLRYRLKGVPPIGPHRPLPEVIRPELRDEWAAWREARHEMVASSPKVHAYTIELLSSLDGAVAMNWEVCSSLGMRRVWPFLTRQVIEIVASLRPHDLVVPTHKRLSRVGFRGTVPDRWLLRSDDGSFGKKRSFPGEAFGPLPSVLEPLFVDEVVSGEEKVTDEVAALAVGAGLQLARSLAALEVG